MDRTIRHEDPEGAKGQWMNNFGMVSAMAFEPRKAFAEIDARPRFWFPLLVLILATVAALVWYRSVVDLEWVADREARAAASAFGIQLTEAQVQQSVERAVRNRTLGTVAVVIGAPILITVFGLLTALYFLLAGRITGVRRSFRHWFSFVWWTGLPGAILSLVAAALVLLTTTTTQIDQADLKPLNINSLLALKSFGQPGYALFSSMDLIQLFSLYLSIVGVRAWSGRSWLFSSLFALLPYVLIYGIWAFISLR